MYEINFLEIQENATLIFMFNQSNLGNVFLTSNFYLPNTKNFLAVSYFL